MIRRPQTDTEIWCSACKSMHNKSCFGRDKNSPTGFTYACNVAVKERNKQSHSKNKEANNKRHRDTTKRHKSSPDVAIWTIKKLLADAKRRARIKGIEFTVTSSDIGIPEICPLLGIRLTYSANGKRINGSASIDRIDSRIGYTPKNCWVISWRANQIKNDATIEEIVTMAMALSHHINGKLVKMPPIDGKVWGQYPPEAP